MFNPSISHEWLINPIAEHLTGILYIVRADSRIASGYSTRVASPRGAISNMLRSEEGGHLSVPSPAS